MTPEEIKSMALYMNRISRRNVVRNEYTNKILDYLDELSVGSEYNIKVGENKYTLKRKCPDVKTWQVDKAGNIKAIYFEEVEL